MLAVALGHWAAIAIGIDDTGALWAGNALEHAPSMAWLTWLFQVMPLFFVVGGFASAMSLDAHWQRGGRSEDWVAHRLRRMLAPAVLLAGTWATVLAAGVMSGTFSVLAVGAVAAAIPLWFLANYTIDTALAPYVLPRFRRAPEATALLGVAAFCAIELMRFGGVPVVPQLNWVLGWLLFQVAGFAWRDGLLPSGHRMAGVASALWIAAIAAVTLGPWPVAMVHFPGLAHSPTHPPTLALLLFGAAYSATAVAVAPVVTGLLARNSARSQAAWRGVVAANGIAMSVYLWHMTAAVGAGAALWGLGLLPTADVGSMAWWWQKVPLVVTSVALLAVIVCRVHRVERRALLAEPQPWRGNTLGLVGTAAAVSGSVKLWASGSAVQAACGLAAICAVWMVLLRAKPVAEVVR